MLKIGSNEIMVFLLGIGGVVFLLSQILRIPISEMGLNLVFILLFVFIMVIHAWKTLGFREMFVFFLIAFCIPLLYEYTDGLGFGGLVGCTVFYSDLLGPKFFDKVPYVIPVMWSVMLYGAFTMTNILFNRIRTTRTSEEVVSIPWFLRIIGLGIVTGLIMASLDLIMDPVMVEMGAWTWSVGGPYYGIPLWNYYGWIEISAYTFICYSVYLLLVKKNQIYIDGKKKSSFTLMVVVLYLVSLFVYAIYAVEAIVTYAILWAAIASGFFACIVVFQFYRSVFKGETQDSSSPENRRI